MKTLKAKAKQLLKEATKHGVEHDFMFVTTFERYLVQLDILENLSKTIKKESLMLDKETANGKSIQRVVHPAISEYNKTATATNQTAVALLKIIKGLRKDNEEETKEDQLLKFISGNG